MEEKTASFSLLAPSKVALCEATPVSHVVKHGYPTVEKNTGLTVEALTLLLRPKIDR